MICQLLIASRQLLHQHRNPGRAGFVGGWWHQLDESGGGGDEALSAVVEDFLQGFEYYLDRHAPQQTEPAESAAGGLKNLIEQAKREV